MNKWQKAKHFKLTIGSIIFGIVMYVTDGTLVFLIILPLLALSKEIKIYDLQIALERKRHEMRNICESIN